MIDFLGGWFHSAKWDFFEEVWGFEWFLKSALFGWLWISILLVIGKKALKLEEFWRENYWKWEEIGVTKNI